MQCVWCILAHSQLECSSILLFLLNLIYESPKKTTLVQSNSISQLKNKCHFVLRNVWRFHNDNAQTNHFNVENFCNAFIRVFFVLLMAILCECISLMSFIAVHFSYSEYCGSNGFYLQAITKIADNFKNNRIFFGSLFLLSIQTVATAFQMHIITRRNRRNSCVFIFCHIHSVHRRQEESEFVRSFRTMPSTTFYIE